MTIYRLKITIKWQYILYNTGARRCAHGSRHSVHRTGPLRALRGHRAPGAPPPRAGRSRRTPARTRPAPKGELHAPTNDSSHHCSNPSNAIDFCSYGFTKKTCELNKEIYVLASTKYPGSECYNRLPRTLNCFVD